MPLFSEPSSSDGVHGGDDASDADASVDEARREDDIESPADAGPEVLLRRAQAAMRKGDIANARTVALELAVAMARMEYEQAQNQLAESERQLVTNAKDIEQAETAVELAEQELSRTEELLAARDSENNACRERIAMIDEELSVLSAELSDIDAEIAALQKKRAEQVNRLENKREEREESIDSEGRLQTEMESLMQETEAVRTRLNAAHEHTRHKQEDRRKIEAAIHMAREASEVRRLSLLAIERTLGSDEAPDAARNSAEETLL
jgi:chromosome segregation ATPase